MMFEVAILSCEGVPQTHMLKSIKKMKSLLRGEIKKDLDVVSLITCAWNKQTNRKTNLQPKMINKPRLSRWTGAVHV